MTRQFSRDKRRLPRIAIGSRREPNRYLVLIAHDPLFNNDPKGPRVTYPGKRVLGQAWMETRGPWLVVLHRDMRMGEEPQYEILRLVPVASWWGQRPMDAMKEAVRREAKSIEYTWNTLGVKPDEEQKFRQNEFTGRPQP